VISVITAMQFTAEGKHLIKQLFLTEDEVMMG